MIVCAVAVGVSLGYCLFLLAVAAAANRNPSPARLPTLHTTRFCILVPAHNEELVLAATLKGLTRLDYLPSLLQIVVIADNCTDTTAQIAAGYENVRVLERRNETERGKGYALNWAISQLLPNSGFDAYVIVDADTQVDPQFLSAMERAFCGSGEGGTHFAAQGRYDVLNAEDGWRTALMAGALSLAHRVRPLARERLGLTVGLKGNGMCFSTETLRAVAWSASLTEDIDFAMDLIEQLDLPVHYVPDAIVAAQMPVTEQASRSQRRRWESGRFEILRRRGWRLLRAGLREGNPKKIDAALDLIVPPQAEIAAGLVGWAALIGVDGLIGGHVGGWLLGWAAAVGLLLCYVLVGFAVGDAPKAAYTALLRAPGYFVWKLALRFAPKDRGSSGNGGLPGGGSGAWVRTERTAIPTAEPQSAPGAAE